MSDDQFIAGCVEYSSDSRSPAQNFLITMNDGSRLSPLEDKKFKAVLDRLEEIELTLKDIEANTRSPGENRHVFRDSNMSEKVGLFSHVIRKNPLRGAQRLSHNFLENVTRH